jgi:hypothetical protein
MSGKLYENKRGTGLTVHPHGRHEDQWLSASDIFRKLVRACTKLETKRTPVFDLQLHPFPTESLARLAAAMLMGVRIYALA